MLLPPSQTDILRREHEMTVLLSVRADQVRVGDRVFNRYAYHPTAAWELVWRIDSLLSREVRLYTGIDREHPTVSHYLCAEGVAVTREDVDGQPKNG